MLIYLDSPSFPGKTFSILAEKHETVARARGHFLHVLHSQGLTDMPCRFALDNTDQELLKDTDIIGDCVEDKADAPARLKFFVDPRPPPPPELRSASQAITSLWPMAKKVNQVEKARLSAKSEVTDKFSSLEEALGVKLRQRTDGKGRQDGKRKQGNRRSVFDNPHLISDISTAVQAMRRHPTLRLLPDGDFEPAPFETVKDVNLNDDDVKLRRLEAYAIAGALAVETKWFEQREAWLFKAKVMLWTIVPLVALCLASDWWFTAIISFAWWIPMFTFLPTYTRVGGMMADMHTSNKVYATVATIGFIFAALLVGSQTGVEIAKLTSACNPNFEETATNTTNSTAAMTRGECLVLYNEEGPSSTLECSNEGLYPIGSAAAAADAGAANDGFFDIATDIGDSLANAGDTLTSFYDITSDVGECSPTRIIMNFGLLAYTLICLTLSVYFGKLLSNFRHRAGDLIEAALIQNGPVDELLSEALNSSPDVARAAVLKMSAMIASASQEVVFDDDDDRANEFYGQQLLDELREAGCAEALCKLSKSDDPLIRMHAAEAIERFVLEPQCMQSFIEGGGGQDSGLQCIMHLLTASCAIQQDGRDNYTFKHTAKYATEALLVIIIQEQLESVAGAVFEETDSLSKVASGVVRGAFTAETNDHLLGIFMFLLHESENALEHRAKTNAHESVCELLTALVIHCDSEEQLVVGMQCVLAMYDSDGTSSAVMRSYVRAMMAMPHSRLDISVRKLVVEVLLKAASGGGAVAEYLITFDKKLVAVLKETINTEYVEFVRAAVMVVHELTHSDTSMGHMLADLEDLLDHALVIDSAHEDIRRAVEEAKARLRDQASNMDY